MRAPVVPVRNRFLGSRLAAPPLLESVMDESVFVGDRCVQCANNCLHRQVNLLAYRRKAEEWCAYWSPKCAMSMEVADQADDDTLRCAATARSPFFVRALLFPQ